MAIPFRQRQHDTVNAAVLAAISLDIPSVYLRGIAPDLSDLLSNLFDPGDIAVGPLNEHSRDDGGTHVSFPILVKGNPLGTVTHYYRPSSTDTVWYSGADPRIFRKYLLNGGIPPGELTLCKEFGIRIDGSDVPF